MDQASEDQQAIRLVDLVYRLARSVADEARDAVSEVAALDLGDFLLLRQVASGQATPGELARQMHAHPAAMSRTLTRLTRAGLVERRPVEEDFRRLRIELTEHGRAVTDRIAAALRPALQVRFDRLEPQEADLVLDALSRLMAAGRPVGDF